MTRYFKGHIDIVISGGFRISHRGRQPKRVGCQPGIWPKFPENYETLVEEGARVLVPPLDPPTVNISSCNLEPFEISILLSCDFKRF